MPASQLGNEHPSQARHSTHDTQVSRQFQDSIPDGSYHRVSMNSYVTSAKLNENYWSWNKVAKLQLQTMNLWAVVSGDEPQPDRLARPQDFEAWTVHDIQAQLWIRRSIEHDQLQYLDDAASAEDMWRSLQQCHRSWAKLVSLKRRLIAYKAKPGSSVEIIAGELSGLRMSITDIDPSEAPLDLDLALRLMDSVQGKEYTVAKFLLEETQDLTFSHVRQRLHNVDWKKRFMRGERMV